VVHQLRKLLLQRSRRLLLRKQRLRRLRPAASSCLRLAPGRFTKLLLRLRPNLQPQLLVPQRKLGAPSREADRSLTAAAQVAVPEPAVPVSAPARSMMGQGARAGRCIPLVLSPADPRALAVGLVSALLGPVSVLVQVLVRLARVWARVA
jgi:hypothetical protein